MSHRPGLEDAPMSGVFEEERRLEDGRRQITLRANERREIAERRLAEGAAALFLDLDAHHTWKEIAEELDISLSKLKDLTKSEDFELAYNQLFSEISHDPRYRAVQANLADMLPLATKTLKDLLIANDTAGGVKLRTAQTIFKYAGIRAPDEVMSERKALAEFLSNYGMAPGTSPDIPDDYEDAMEEYNVDIIEGEFEEDDPDEEDLDENE